jgi:hypothetical protein
MRVVKNIKGWVIYDVLSKRYNVYQRNGTYPILVTCLEDSANLSSNECMKTTGLNEIKYIKLNKGYFEVYEGKLRFYGNIQLLKDF